MITWQPQLTFTAMQERPSFSLIAARHTSRIKVPPGSGCENPTLHSSSVFFPPVDPAIQLTPYTPVCCLFSHTLSISYHTIYFPFFLLSSTQKCAYLMQHEPQRPVPMSVMTQSQGQRASKVKHEG